MVWVPPQSGHEGYFLSADNLGYIARQLGVEKEYLQEKFVADGRQPILRNPDAKTNQNRKNLLAGRRIIKVDYQENAYATLISILAEPRTFMALVPANKAMDVVKTIKQKYETEMGKVRNRLPLHLGVVYAGRRTPLASVLDAGRRMLRRASQTEQAEVKAISSVNPWLVIVMRGLGTPPIRYSMIFSAGSNGVISFSPMDWIAMRTSSASGWPGERCCFV
jgi:hypothetical protein